MTGMGAGAGQGPIQHPHDAQRRGSNGPGADSCPVTA
jgi:hypothetical protein